MNYIRHLNAFFIFIRSDNRLTSSHVSLYLALFQYWNFNRFQNPFPVYRDDIMKLCKIGSKNTYHKCIRELYHCKYIIYHPAASKYQPVKISMIRLDKQMPNDPKQLNLFSPKSDTHTGIKNETQHVPILTDTSTDFDTAQVPNMGHLIKPNNKQERETPTHQILKKNKKIQNSINDFAAGSHFPSPSGEGGRRPDEADFGHVPKSVHTEKNIPSREGLGVDLPSLNEVEDFFKQNKYPPNEAKIFFNHYKAIGWKIQGKTPIEDWKALVEKWMQNTKKWEISSFRGSDSQSRGRSDPEKDLQHLYDSFLEGKKIFKYILPEHFNQLKLELTEETLLQARQERIEQFTGTNQNSIIKLWEAYLTGDPNHVLVSNDKPNLIALAKRMAVIKHFNNLKNQTT